MRFHEFLNTYDNYAFVQKKVAQKLIEFLEKNEEFETVLEIGCGTGIYSQKLVSHIKYRNIIMFDIYNSGDYVANIKKSQFLIKDMDRFDYKKYSLITSSSVFQWSKDFEQLLNKISSATDRLLFSIYIDGNLPEIENHFEVGLKYYEHKNILKQLKKKFKFVKFEVEEIILEFSKPLDALKHLKYTGVTGLSKNIKISRIKNFDEHKLTYKVAYYNCWN